MNWHHVGYWLDVATPVNQILVWDLSYLRFIPEFTTLSNQGMRMTRIQPFPQLDAAAVTALFEEGVGDFALENNTLPNFPGDITGRWSADPLTCLGYDTVDGTMVGCLRDKVASAQFVWNQDWNTLQAAAQQMAAD